MSLDLRIELDAEASVDFLDGQLVVDTPDIRIVFGPTAVANMLREALVTS